MRVSSDVSPARPDSAFSLRRALYAFAAFFCLALSSCSSGSSNNNPPPPDTTPPTAPTALTATAAAPTQINLSWTASTDNFGVTSYQIQRCQGAGCTNFAQIGTTTTAVTFSDTTVVASTSYGYRVSAKDAAGNTSGFSATNSATTPATPDATPPSAPSGLTANAISGAQINLAWTASTDNVGVTGYQIQRCQGASCSNFTNLGAPITAITFSDTTVVNANSYGYRVSAKDAAGNTSLFSNTASATTPDTTPPTAPSGLTATAISGTQINLSWTASTDNVGVTGYQIQRCQGAGCSNFANLGAPITTTTFSDTTVLSAISYRYQVTAKDAAGNTSPASNIASATTPDNIPPTAPSGLTATVAAGAASATQINLSWTTSTDNVAVTGYQVQRCTGVGCSSFANLGAPTTATTFNDIGLTPSTSYSYRVSAKDAAGNVSSFSNTGTSATTADTTPPSAPGNLTANATSSTQINLSWTASTDNVGVTGYQIQRCQGAGCSSFANLGSPTAAITFNDTTVVASTSYSYRVDALDAANNTSSFSNTASATTPASGPAISITISPRRGGLTTTQALAVTATVTNDASNMGVNWSVTGGGSFSSPSSASGTPVTYTAPGTAGSVTVTATSKADGTKSASTTLGVTDIVAVSTYQNDPQRTGQNTHEFALTPSIVNSTNFGRLFACFTTEGGTVAGKIYAQPLYVANLNIGGVKHNVLFVVTQSDWVYAFDADASPCQTLWKASMLDFNSTPKHDPISGETTVPSDDTGEPSDLIPEIGITSTPVIDTATNTIYLTAKSKESSTSYHYRLHALDITTGAEKFGGPAEISATAPGTGFAFNPLTHMQRPGLLLSGNNVYLAFGSHGDHGNYHGWLMGYDKSALTQTSVWVSTDTAATGTLGAIWQAGAGPALDPNGNIWVETANGDFDGTVNFGDSVVKLNLAANAVADFFTPFDQDTLRINDVDLGSGGVTILPDSAGSPAHLHLALAAGKTNRLYLIDQANLGRLAPNANDTNIVQELTINGVLNEVSVLGGMFSKAAYFNGRIYVVPVGDVFRAFSVSNALLAPLAPTGADTFGYPGATPSVSSQGASTNGIVWALNTNNNDTNVGSGSTGPAVLFAYDAATLNKLYSSPASQGAGAAVDAIKFVIPTVANGKVYVAGQGAVTVFGLLP